MYRSSEQSFKVKAPLSQNRCSLLVQAQSPHGLDILVRIECLRSDRAFVVTVAIARARF